MNSIGTELDTPWSHELWRSTLLREPHRQGTAVRAPLRVRAADQLRH